MGKSTAAAFLEQSGLPVIDTDLIARELVEPGQDALEEIIRTFGADLVGPDGRLRRDELAKRVFSDPVARKELEGILHPRIREVWQARVAGWQSESRTVGVVVIPLLFETEANPHFDAIVCLACSRDTQRARLQARGWAAQQQEQRIQAQWPIEKKMTLSNYVVWTEGSLEVHAEQLRRVMGRLIS